MWAGISQNHVQSHVRDDLDTDLKKECGEDSLYV